MNDAEWSALENAHVADAAAASHTAPVGAQYSLPAQDIIDFDLGARGNEGYLAGLLTNDGTFSDSDAVQYASVFGTGTSAFDSLMQEITGIGEKSGITGWVKENEKLASMLAAGGAGLLKNLGQQSMLEDQREWVSKRDAEKRAQDLEDRDHQEKLRKFAPVAPLKTGLLDSVKKRTEGAKA